jgi:transposase
MNNGNRKFFTDEEVREIRRLKLEGLSNRKIAKIFNKGKDSINNIVNGKTYLDII